MFKYSYVFFPLLHLRADGLAVCRGLEASGESPAPLPPLVVVNTTPWKARQHQMHFSHYPAGSTPDPAQAGTQKTHLGFEIPFFLSLGTHANHTPLLYSGAILRQNWSGNRVWKTETSKQNKLPKESISVIEWDKVIGLDENLVFLCYPAWEKRGAQMKTELDIEK